MVPPAISVSPRPRRSALPPPLPTTILWPLFNFLFSPSPFSSSHQRSQCSLDLGFIQQRLLRPGYGQLLPHTIYTWYMCCSRMAVLDDTDTQLSRLASRKDMREYCTLDRVQGKRQGVRLTFLTRGPRHGIDFVDNSCTRVGRTRVSKYVTFQKRYVSIAFVPREELVPCSHDPARLFC
jgi:hypothetical protein